MSLYIKKGKRKRFMDGCIARDRTVKTELKEKYEITAGREAESHLRRLYVQGKNWKQNYIV